MKTKIYSFLIALPLLFFVGCNPDKDDDPTPTADISGTWKAQETSSTYGTQNYYVDISKDLTNSSKFNIDNFFNQGTGKVFSCIQNGSNLTLSSIPFEGFQFSGTGSISTDFKTITWSYTFDEGNGPENGTATYTKL